MKNKWLFLWLYCLPFQVVAHPHVFLDIKNQVQIEQGKLQRFVMSWILDEITSAELIYEINSSKNPAAAKGKITDELSESAINAHYFSELYDDKDTPIKFKAKPRNPKIEVQDNRVFYHFDLVLATPPEVAGRHFRLFTFEPSYYLYMGYEKTSDLTVQDPENLCKVALIEPKVNKSLRLYASTLDKNDTPDMPAGTGLSLGAQFAQKVSIECR